MNMTNNKEFMVCVQCMTFNHANYIEDALNGFTMQQTTFPFVCIIIDDASTDGEPEVIRKYLQENFDLEDQSVVRNEETNDYILNFAQHKTNKNCYFAVLFLKYNHYSIKKTKMPYIKEWQDNAKYIALCEGDDYWINPAKLQKQANILECYPECSMAVSSNYVLHVEDKLFSKATPIPIETSRFLTMSEVLQEKGGLIPTASMFFRKDLLDKKPKEFSTPYVGDRPLRMWCAVNGLIYYDIKPLTVYRAGSIGSFSQRTHNNSWYASEVLKTMFVFYDYFDKYTKFEYHEDVVFMKNREEFNFYKRTINSNIFNCAFFHAFPFRKKVKVFLKYYKEKFVPSIISQFCRIIKKHRAKFFERLPEVVN